MLGAGREHNLCAQYKEEKGFFISLTTNRMLSVCAIKVIQRVIQIPSVFRINIAVASTLIPSGVDHMLILYAGNNIYKFKHSQ